MGERYVLGFEEIGREEVALAGGKGAGLGELSRIEGVSVPPGFCVTTGAFQRAVAAGPGIDKRLDRLSRLDPGDREAISALSAEIRRAIEAAVIPGDVAAEITRWAARLGQESAYAVRSSATAEDLPAASFAGQHDSYLDVTGTDSVLRHVARCWASLFTERAVTYRARNGFGHEQVRMAVVVQRMVSARASGVMFTADPVTSNRKVVSIEAVSGPGEALVSGLVSPDSYHVRDGGIIGREERQERRALTDAQVLRLAELGRLIEERLGRPQDIEWCAADDKADGEFQVVQSRPVTTLFPVPEADDDGNHVYVSVGHQQMMTDPMKPLGISLWQLTAGRPMHTAGGRLFVDITRELGSPATRDAIVNALGTSDPLIGDALRSVIDRGDFIPETPIPETPVPERGDNGPALSRPLATPAPMETDPAIVTGIIERVRASLDTLKRDIQGKSGKELADFIVDDVKELKRVLFTPDNMRVIRPGSTPAGGSTSTCGSGWARRTPPTPSRSPRRATSRRRWGSHSWTSPT